MGNGKYLALWQRQSSNTNKAILYEWVDKDTKTLLKKPEGLIGSKALDCNSADSIVKIDENTLYATRNSDDTTAYMYVVKIVAGEVNTITWDKTSQETDTTQEDEQVFVREGGAKLAGQPGGFTRAVNGENKYAAIQQGYISLWEWKTATAPGT